MRKQLTIFAAAALASSAALADQHMAGEQQQSTDQQSQSFEQLDQDKDGKISQEEAGANLELTGYWVELDANKDGSLDVTEFSRFEPVAEGDADPQQQMQQGGEQMQQSDQQMQEDAKQDHQDD